MLSVRSSPSGPVFPAASWVRLACRHDNVDRQNLPSLSYSWMGTCSRTGKVVIRIADPLMDEEGWAIIWVQSTPLDCLDAFHCTAQGSDRELVAAGNFSFGEISGKF